MKESYSLNEIYSYLSRFRLSESLYTIGAINSALKYGGDSYFRENIPGYITYWLDMFGNKQVSNLEMLLQTSRMARLLLLSGASDYRSKMLVLGTPEFQTAFNMIGRLREPEIEKQFENEKTVSSFFGRMSSWQFPLQSDRLIPLGRAYLLFIEIPKRLNQEYDYDLKMREFFDIGVLEYLNCGYALWQTTNGTLDYQVKVELEPLKSIVTSSNLSKMVRLVTGSHTQYRLLIRGDHWKNSDPYKDLYALDPFLTIPALAVANSTKLRTDSFVVPQPKYLLDKISTGVFYLLADQEQQAAKKENVEHKKNSFRNSFGEVYREYVKMQLQQAKMPVVLVDLDTEFENASKRKIPDFALLCGDICVLIEVKTSILKVKSRTYFEPDQLRKEVDEGSLPKALQQLHSFKQAILNRTVSDTRFDRINSVVCLLVCYEDIYVLNSTLLPILKEKYPEMSENLQLGCISDVDAIGYGLAHNIDLGELLVQKIDSKIKDSYMVAIEIESQIGRGNDLLKASFKRFIEQMGVKMS